MRSIQPPSALSSAPTLLTTNQGKLLMSRQGKELSACTLGQFSRGPKPKTNKQANSLTFVARPPQKTELKHEPCLLIVRHHRNPSLRIEVSQRASPVCFMFIMQLAYCSVRSPCSGCSRSDSRCCSARGRRLLFDLGMMPIPAARTKPGRGSRVAGRRCAAVVVGGPHPGDVGLIF